jgi:hypothetical protein
MLLALMIPRVDSDERLPQRFNSRVYDVRKAFGAMHENFLVFQVK